MAVIALTPRTTAGAVHETRESWLLAAVEALRPEFDAIGAPLPENIQVSVSISSKGVRSKTIGECWSASASGGVNTIFIHPSLDTPSRVLGVLIHELVHAADDCKNGHGPAFRKVATAIGLTGKMTATTESEELTAWLNGLVDAVLGDYPHEALRPYGAGKDGGPKDKPKKSSPKTQTTRYKKVACANHPEYKVRMTRKWLEDEDFGAPICPACGTIMVEEV